MLEWGVGLVGWGVGGGGFGIRIYMVRKAIDEPIRGGILGNMWVLGL